MRVRIANTLSMAGLLWRLMRFDRPAGIWLLLWPTLSGLWIAAQGFPGWKYFTIFTVGTVLMRAAGSVLNDIWDRRFDLHVARTQTRVLTSGQVRVTTAVITALVLLALSASLLIFFNAQTRCLAVIAALITASYPSLKRFFPWPQAYLGLAFSFGVPMAFSELTGRVPGLAWLLVLANTFWTLAYDTEYAMVDRDDDLKLGLRSSAIALGQRDLPFIALCYLLHLSLLALVFTQIGWHLAMLLALLIAAVFVGMHLYWIRDRARDACLRAFLHNHWIGFVLWLGLVFTYAAHYAR